MTLTLTPLCSAQSHQTPLTKTVILLSRTQELLVAEICIQHLYSSSTYIFLEYHYVFIIFLKPSHSNPKTWSCCPLAQLLYYRILVTTFPWSFEYLADWNLQSHRPPCLSFCCQVLLLKPFHRACSIYFPCYIKSWWALWLNSGLSQWKVSLVAL